MKKLTHIVGILLCTALLVQGQPKPLPEEFEKVLTQRFHLRIPRELAFQEVEKAGRVRGQPVRDSIFSARWETTKEIMAAKANRDNLITLRTQGDISAAICGKPTAPKNCLVDSLPTPENEKVLHLRFDGRVPGNRRYVARSAALALQEIKKYLLQLPEAERVVINSGPRPVAKQVRLIRAGYPAADAWGDQQSTHLRGGTTVDISIRKLSREGRELFLFLLLDFAAGVATPESAAIIVEEYAVYHCVLPSNEVQLQTFRESLAKRFLLWQKGERLSP